MKLFSELFTNKIFNIVLWFSFRIRFQSSISHEPINSKYSFHCMVQGNASPHPPCFKFLYAGAELVANRHLCVCTIDGLSDSNIRVFLAALTERLLPSTGFPNANWVFCNHTGSKKYLNFYPNHNSSLNRRLDIFN